jgi:hypothetical protein
VISSHATIPADRLRTGGISEDRYLELFIGYAISLHQTILTNIFSNETIIVESQQ